MISYYASDSTAKNGTADERRARLQALSKGLVTQSPPFIERVHRSGLSPLDRLLGQGVSSGQVVEWSGAVSCGKTGLLRAFIRSVRRRGVAVAWIDSRRTLLATDWAEPMAGPLWIFRPPRPKDAFFCVEAALRTQSFGIVVLDGAPLAKRSLYLRLQKLARQGGAALVTLDTLDRSVPQARKRIRIVSSGLEGNGFLPRKGPLRWRIEAQDLRDPFGQSNHQFVLEEPRSKRLYLGHPVRDRPDRQGRSGERYGR